MELPTRRVAGAREAPGPAAGSVRAPPAVPRGGSQTPLLAPARVPCCSPQERRFNKGDTGLILAPSPTRPGLKESIWASTFNFRDSFFLYGSCSCWEVTCYNQNPKGPGTPLPSGVKNVQWDRTLGQPFSLRRFHLYMKLAALCGIKSWGGRRPAPAPAGQ